MGEVAKNVIKQGDPTPSHPPNYTHKHTDTLTPFPVGKPLIIRK